MVAPFEAKNDLQSALSICKINGKNDFLTMRQSFALIVSGISFNNRTRDFGVSYYIEACVLWMSFCFSVVQAYGRASFFPILCSAYSAVVVDHYVSPTLCLTFNSFLFGFFACVAAGAGAAGAFVVVDIVPCGKGSMNNRLSLMMTIKDVEKYCGYRRKEWWVLCSFF